MLLAGRGPPGAITAMGPWGNGGSHSLPAAWPHVYPLVSLKSSVYGCFKPPTQAFVTKIFVLKSVYNKWCMKLCSALIPSGHIQECWAGSDTAPALRKLPVTLAADAAGLLFTGGTWGGEGFRFGSGQAGLSGTLFIFGENGVRRSQFEEPLRSLSPVCFGYDD